MTSTANKLTKYLKEDRNFVFELAPVSHAINNCSQDPQRVLSSGSSFLQGTRWIHWKLEKIWLMLLDTFSLYFSTCTLVCCIVRGWFVPVISFRGGLCGPKLLVIIQLVSCVCATGAEGLMGDGIGGGPCLNCWLWPGFCGLYIDCWPFGGNPKGLVDTFFSDLTMETASFCFTGVLGCSMFDLNIKINQSIVTRRTRNLAQACTESQ